MSRLWDLVIGGGIVVCLLALVACAVQMVLEVLAVEASRRKDAGRGQSADGSSRPQAPGPALSDEDMSSFLDDEIARTARRIIEAQGLVP